MASRPQLVARTVYTRFAGELAVARRAFASGATKSLAAPSCSQQSRNRPSSILLRARVIAHPTLVIQRRLESSTATVPAGTSTASETSKPKSTPPPPRRPLQFLARALLSTTLVLVAFVAGTAMAAAPAVETIQAWANPPTDAETLELFESTSPNGQEINERIKNHPLAAKLRQEAGWTESRPHMKIPPPMRQYNLTGGTLLGENKIEVPPLTFSETEAELPKMVQLSYLGMGLCGHPGIVHGGLLATMLDEGLARCCFHALPNKVGVTASLKIDYRVPCPGNSYVVLKAETTKVEGRKAWVKGWIELLGEEDGTGVKLVEAEALFIEPKGAKNMARVYSAT